VCSSDLTSRYGLKTIRCLCMGIEGENRAQDDWVGARRRRVEDPEILGRSQRPMAVIFPLATTGAVPWTTILTDPHGNLAPAIAQTSNARGRVRGSLKTSKRTDEDARDWNVIAQVCCLGPRCSQHTSSAV
jgi:hypothetical protein